jgi:parvulin-like peptidyl-prolyl isomerase
MIRKRIFLYFTLPLFMISGCGQGGGEIHPSNPKVVASFNGGEITQDQLKAKYEELMPCCKERYQGAEGQKTFIKQMVLPAVIADTIKKKKINIREGIREKLGNLTGELNISFLHMKFHEEILDTNKKHGELRENYEFQKRRLEGYPLSERYDRLVQLHQQIHAQIAKEVETVAKQYIQRLRREASITRDFETLKIKVTEDDLKHFYQKHQEGLHGEEYRVPERVKIEEIKLNVEKGEEDCPTCPKEGRAKEMAQKALDELRSGAEFHTVARKYSSDIPSIGPKWLDGGRNGKEFDDAVFSLEVSETSPVFKSGNSFYIVRMLEKEPGYLKPYEAVRDQIEMEYRWQKGEEHLKDNGDRILFTINGKPYTIGDFIKAYTREVPAHGCHHQQKTGMRKAHEKEPQLCDFAHNDFEEQKRIIDGMIDRELIIEDTFNQMIQVEHQKEIEFLTMASLYPIFHQEEMEREIRITDEMVKTYHRKHKEEYQSPAKAKIRMILIKGGEKREEKEKAYQKAKTVYREIKPSFLSFKKGRDFGEVARESSDDSQTASKGGALDVDIYECRNAVEYMLLHGFHKKIFELEPGDISDVFEFGGDYYLIEIKEMENRKEIPFQDIKEEVKKDLMAKEHQKVMERWEDDLLKSVEFVIYGNTLKEMIPDVVVEKKARR